MSKVPKVSTILVYLPGSVLTHLSVEEGFQCSKSCGDGSAFRV
jgi:hypothetical protein